MVTQALITRLLSDGVIDLIRVVVADAPRFPALAKLTGDSGRMRGINAVTSLIAGHSQRSRNGRERATHKRGAQALATRIFDAVTPPLMVRALTGENLDDVRSDIPSHVKQTIGLFVAANDLAPFL